MLNRATALLNFADADAQFQRRYCSISPAEALNFNAVCRLKRGLRFKDFRERFQKEVPPILLKKAERYASMNFMERDSRNRSTTTPLPIHRKT